MNINDLKQQRRWLCHKNKVPKNPYTGGAGSSTDPKTWATYDEAVTARDRYKFDGVGFVLNGDGLVGIDLDSSIVNSSTDEDGVILRTLSPYARHLIYLAESYAEVSPSGKGLHIVGFGKISASFKDRIWDNKVEIYDNARYFTYTGDFVHGYEDDDGVSYPWDFVDIQSTLDSIFDDHEASRQESEPHVEELVPVPYEAGTSSNAFIEAVVKRRVDAAVDMVKNATDGQRHHVRFRAGRLIGGYLEAAEKAGVNYISDSKATELLYDAQKPAQGSQKSERKTIEDGIRYGRKSPVTLPTPTEPVKPITASPVELSTEIEEVPVDFDEYHLTDLGNGRRMVTSCADRLCYVPEWKQWLVWDGRRWMRSDDAGVSLLAHHVVLSIYDTISSVDTLEERKQITKWAQTSESSQRIDAMIKTARSYLTKSAALFDTHTDIVIVKNGVLDLRTGNLTPHNRKLYMTKALDIDYDPTARAPRWMRFIGDILPSSTLVAYARRMLGYVLTGRTDEHCLFFLYGSGKNGKSTFLEAVRLLMGDYYTVTNVEALLSADFTGGATPYVAALAGMRCAMASEMPEGRRFNESLVKDITGGGTITARTLYGSPFQFQPSHKLIISGNHRPRITGTDEGIWRRLRVIPFTQTIEKPRPMLEIMNDFIEELPGILTWSVQGAKDWYVNGMPATDEIEKATMEYRGEEDVVARFIADRCVVRTESRGEKHAVYEEWQRWTEDENELGANKWPQRRFTEAIKRKGFELGGQGRRFYMGIGLLFKSNDSANESAHSA
jgi:putative DNA primase/helicase